MVGMVEMRPRQQRRVEVELEVEEMMVMAQGQAGRQRVQKRGKKRRECR